MNKWQDFKEGTRKEEFPQNFREKRAIVGRYRGLWWKNIRKGRAFG
jgi:hypothetical protein